VNFTWLSSSVVVWTAIFEALHWSGQYLLFFLYIVPLLIGIGGVTAAILFRRRMRGTRQAEMRPGE
jgi:hypothetical protein